MKKLIILVVIAALGAAAWPHRDAGPDKVLVVSRGPFARRIVADGTLRAVTATAIVVPDTDAGVLELAWLAPDGTAVNAGDVIARFDPANATKALREVDADLATAETQLREEQVRAGASITQADAAVESAQHDLDDLERFKPTDAQIFSRNQILEGDLDAKVAEARTAVAKLSARIGRNVASAGVELARIERDRIAVIRDRAAKQLGDLEVRAPHAGVLVLTRNERGEALPIGAQVSRGHELATLPDVTAMEAELFVLEVDGDGLATGQPVDMVLQSQPDQHVRGTIASVDKVAKPRQPGVPVNYVSVVVSLAVTDPSVMKPGQRVHATIALAPQQAIVVPRLAVFERNGRPVVYRGDLVRGFVPVPVTLGAASAGHVAVTTGLSPGDVITLSGRSRPDSGQKDVKP